MESLRELIVMDSINHRANVLTPDQSKILTALADRIFPRTETPGAVEIGAVQYIEVALAGDYAALAAFYRRGLRAIERCARRSSAGHFVCSAKRKRIKCWSTSKPARCPASNWLRIFLRSYVVTSSKVFFVSLSMAVIAT